MLISGLQFEAGIWVGIALNEAQGKHDGTVNGTEYFACEPGHGVFLRPSAVKPAAAARTHDTPRATPAMPQSFAASSARDTPQREASGPSSGLEPPSTGAAARSKLEELRAARAAANRRALASAERSVAPIPPAAAPASSLPQPPPMPSGLAASPPRTPVASTPAKAVLSAERAASVVAMSKENRALQARLRESEAARAQLTSELATLQAAAAASTAPTAADHEAAAPAAEPSIPLAKHQQIMADSRSQLEQALAQLADVREQAAASDAALAQARTDLHDARLVTPSKASAAEEVQLRTAERTSRRRVAELEAAANAAEDALAAVKLELEEAQVEQEIAETELAIAQDEAAAAQRERDALQAELDDLRAALPALQAMDEDSAEAFTVLRTQNIRLREGIAQLQAQHAAATRALQTELSAATSQAEAVPALREQVVSLQASQASLREEVARLRDAEDESASYEAVLEALTEKNFALADRVQELKSELEFLGELVRASEAAELESETMLADMQANFGQLSQHAATLQRTVLQRNSELSAAQSRIAYQLAALATQREALAAAKAEAARASATAAASAVAPGSQLAVAAQERRLGLALHAALDCRTWVPTLSTAGAVGALGSLSAMAVAAWPAVSTPTSTALHSVGQPLSAAYAALASACCALEQAISLAATPMQTCASHAGSLLSAGVLRTADVACQAAVYIACSVAALDTALCTMTTLWLGSSSHAAFERTTHDVHMAASRAADSAALVAAELQGASMQGTLRCTAAEQLLDSATGLLVCVNDVVPGSYASSTTPGVTQLVLACQVLRAWLRAAGSEGTLTAARVPREHAVWPAHTALQWALGNAMSAALSPSSRAAASAGVVTPAAVPDVALYGLARVAPRAAASLGTLADLEPAPRSASATSAAEALLSSAHQLAVISQQRLAQLHRLAQHAHSMTDSDCNAVQDLRLPEGLASAMQGLAPAKAGTLAKVQPAAQRAFNAAESLLGSVWAILDLSVADVRADTTSESVGAQQGAAAISAAVFLSPVRSQAVQPHASPSCLSAALSVHASHLSTERGAADDANVDAWSGIGEGLLGAQAWQALCSQADDHGAAEAAARGALAGSAASGGDRPRRGAARALADPSEAAAGPDLLGWLCSRVASLGSVPNGTVPAHGVAAMIQALSTAVQPMLQAMPGSAAQLTELHAPPAWLVHAAAMARAAATAATANAELKAERERHAATLTQLQDAREEVHAHRATLAAAQSRMSENAQVAQQAVQAAQRAQSLEVTVQALQRQLEHAAAQQDASSGDLQLNSSGQAQAGRGELAKAMLAGAGRGSSSAHAVTSAAATLQDAVKLQTAALQQALEQEQAHVATLRALLYKRWIKPHAASAHVAATSRTWQRFCIYPGNAAVQRSTFTTPSGAVGSAGQAMYQLLQTAASSSCSAPAGQAPASLANAHLAAAQELAKAGWMDSGALAAQWRAVA